MKQTDEKWNELKVYVKKQKLAYKHSAKAAEDFNHDDADLLNSIAVELEDIEDLMNLLEDKESGSKETLESLGYSFEKGV